MFYFCSVLHTILDLNGGSGNSVGQVDDDAAEGLRDQSVGYWAGEAGRSADALAHATLERHGLTRSQWRTLNLLAERTDAVTLDVVLDHHRHHGDLDEALRPDTLCLVATGLIDDTNGALTLTPAGRTRLDETWPDVRAGLAQFRSGVCDTDYITTIRTLRTMIDNVTDRRRTV